MQKYLKPELLQSNTTKEQLEAIGSVLNLKSQDMQQLRNTDLMQSEKIL